MVTRVRIGRVNGSVNHQRSMNGQRSEVVHQRSDDALVLSNELYVVLGLDE